MKAVFITGATRGLGRGMARHFAARGYKLALAARDPGDLRELESELAANAAQVIACKLDVSDFDTIQPALRNAAELLGGIDIVVANAGLGEPAPAGAGKFAQMRRMIDVNLTGAVATADAAITLFREQGHGQLVGISSVAALRGLPNSGVYSATKAALGKYLEAVRCETHGQNIVVTELAPGYIDTDINRSMASRPFLVSEETGTGIMVDLIEKQVGFRYVPPWPWTLVAQAMKLMPAALLRKL